MKLLQTTLFCFLFLGWFAAARNIPLDVAVDISEMKVFASGTGSIEGVPRIKSRSSWFFHKKSGGVYDRSYIDPKTLVENDPKSPITEDHGPVVLDIELSPAQRRTLNSRSRLWRCGIIKIDIRIIRSDCIGSRLGLIFGRRSCWTGRSRGRKNTNRVAPNCKNGEAETNRNIQNRFMNSRTLSRSAHIAFTIFRTLNGSENFMSISQTWFGKQRKLVSRFTPI